MSPAILTPDAHLNGLKKPHQDGFGTRAIHVGSEPSAETGAVIPAISLSTTYQQEAIGTHKVFSACFSDVFALLRHASRVSNILAQETPIEMRLRLPSPL